MNHVIQSTLLGRNQYFSWDFQLGLSGTGSGTEPKFRFRFRFRVEIWPELPVPAEPKMLSNSIKESKFIFQEDKFKYWCDFFFFKKAIPKMRFSHFFYKVRAQKVYGTLRQGYSEKSQISRDGADRGDRVKYSLIIQFKNIIIFRFFFWISTFFFIFNFFIAFFSWFRPVPSGSE